MSQARFQKQQREKARREKAAAKRDRKELRAAEAEAAAAEGTEPVAPQTEVLAQLAVLHQRFDDDAIDFEEFEERKSELLAKLAV